MMDLEHAIKILIRRAHWLIGKIEACELTSNVSPDKSELGAIRRALLEMGTPVNEIPCRPKYSAEEFARRMAKREELWQRHIEKRKAAGTWKEEKPLETIWEE